MTINEILKELRPAKRMSRVTLYTYIRKLKIKPIGARQIPQRYPDNVPDKILQRLGLKNGHRLVRRMR
jgi:hypothetical protein